MAKLVGVDKWLFFTTMVLVVTGLAMVFSASAVVGQERYHSAYTFVLTQAIWAALGVLAMLVLMHIDVSHYKSPRFIYPALCVTTVLLVLVFLMPGSHHTHRWIRFGDFFTLQPSEIAKPVLVLFLAWFLHKRLDAMRDWKRTLLPGGAHPGAVYRSCGAPARPGHSHGAGRRDRHDADAGGDGVEVAVGRRLCGCSRPGCAAFPGFVAPGARCSSSSTPHAM